MELFLVFSSRLSPWEFFLTKYKGHFSFGKNNHLSFSREKVTFFYEKETFAQRLVEAVSEIAWQRVYIRPEQDAVPLAEMTFSSIFGIAYSKKHKIAFLVVILTFFFFIDVYSGITN